VNPNKNPRSAPTAAELALTMVLLLIVGVAMTAVWFWVAAEIVGWM
jgi:hypothetical protein